MKRFSGKVLFLDRSDINTDEIIPARYLTENEKEALKPHLLEDLVLDGFNAQTDIVPCSIIITRQNFGCGSSREHAPWALEVNGIHGVIAGGFARIFRQNMFNCGMLAIELPAPDVDRLFDRYSASGAFVDVNIDSRTLKIVALDGENPMPDHSGEMIRFDISEFDRALVRAGGWVEYADTHY
jgi:3-isopropylmalate/(R)-2-methylmalate dehydratase small subunit